MENPKKRLILFFVKYPERGKVKTRLAKELEEEIVVELYKNFVEDIILKIKKTSIDYWICYTPPEKENNMKIWLGAEKKYYAQAGINLGDKMKNSFNEAFKKKYLQVVIIGSDSPDLPINILIDSFESLNKNDAVLGPSYDGGYYLLGFNKDSYFDDVFYNVEWSTEKVYGQTLKKVKDKCKFIEMPKWKDVDVLNDLVMLKKNNLQTDFSSSQTISYINKLIDLKIIKNYNP